MHYDELERQCMRSFKRVMCSFGGEEEYRRKVASSLPVSPQDDHVIEFAKQFGWDSTWLEKQQPKKRGKRQMAEQAASRASGDVGEMLASRAGSRETTSQVVPHDHDAAPFAPQVQAAPVAPPVQAAPLAPPSSSAVPIEAPALPATPAAHVMTPPPSRRRARSGSRDSGRSRLAVIARTAQSKAMPRPDSFVADIEAELEAEQSRGAQGEESRGAEGEEPRGAEGEGSHGAEEEGSYPTCVICFEPCNPNDAQYPLEALPCAHVFHVECLRAWRETVRITDRARCPNGCHRAHVHPFFRPHVQPSSSSRDVRAHFGNGGDAGSVAAADDEFEVVSPMSPGDVAFL